MQRNLAQVNLVDTYNSGQIPKIGWQLFGGVARARLDCLGLGGGQQASN